MARWCEPEPDQIEGWRDWMNARPESIRIACAHLEPWSLYRLKTTNQRVTIVSFNEGPPVSVRVTVSGQFNLLTFEREVFGINPADLEPCDLPTEDEPLGAVLNQDQVDENIDALRVLGRPDLWEMAEDGKAIRKSVQ